MERSPASLSFDNQMTNLDVSTDIILKIVFNKQNEGAFKIGKQEKVDDINHAALKANIKLHMPMVGSIFFATHEHNHRKQTFNAMSDESLLQDVEGLTRYRSLSFNYY